MSCKIITFREFWGGGGSRELRRCSVHKYSIFPTLKRLRKKESASAARKEKQSILKQVCTVHKVAEYLGEYKEGI